MNNEIKEILDKFDKVLKNYELDKKFGQMSVDSICHLFPNELIIIKDCITNLQEENDYLKDIVSNTELSDEIKKADKWSKRELYKINYQRLQVNERLNKQYDLMENSLDEKQDRIDRAIKYINAGKTFDDIDVGKVVNKIQNDLLNILQGSDK